jgi:hypothetical protein
MQKRPLAGVHAPHELAQHRRQRDTDPEEQHDLDDFNSCHSVMASKVVSVNEIPIGQVLCRQRNESCNCLENKRIPVRHPGDQKIVLTSLDKCHQSKAVFLRF